MQATAKPKRNLIFAAIFFILAFLSGFLIVFLSNTLFPDNGGFNRTIIFIRPQAGSDDPGYFLVIDEFEPKESVELLFHSYGDLTFNKAAKNAVYNHGGVEMKLDFIGPAIDIQNDTSIVYKYASTHQVEYIKVKPLDKNTRRLVTTITFSNATVNFPSIYVTTGTDQAHLVVNGTDHFLFPRHDIQAGQLSNANLTINGLAGGYRLNATYGLEWLLYRNATSVSFNGTSIHAGDSLSGYFNATTGTTELANDGQGDVDPYEESEPFSDAMLSNLNALTHPYILFNETGLVDLKAKCNVTTGIDPWKTWYTSARTHNNVQSKAFRGRIEEDQAYIDLAVQNMLDIGTTYPDWYDTQYIDQSIRLLHNLFAYDMVYNNISAANRTLIEADFNERLLHLWRNAEEGTEPHNNHMVVETAGLGIGGILFKNQSWIQITQDANDYYLRHQVRPDGPCYEGDIYGRYAYDYGIKFFIALKNAGGYDYFANPKFQKYLNYTSSSVTPLGTTPSFEDCAVNNSLYNLASIATYQVNETNPELASNLRWYFEYCYGSYTGGADVYRITSYKEEITPQVPDLGINPGYAYFDSGQACVRTGWDTDSTFLVISNKYYHQSHVHFDENSIEVYALGKQFLTNPGYPGFGNPGHDSTVATEGSNSVLINGEGQLRAESDGFSACIQNEHVDFIESPCYSAYTSPININKNPGNLVVLATILFCFVAIGLINLHKFVKPGGRKQEDQSSKPDLSRIDNSVATIFTIDDDKLLNYDFCSRKLQAISLLVITGIITIPNLLGIQSLVNYMDEQVDFINMSTSLRNMVHDLAPMVSGVLYAAVPLVIMAVLALIMLFNSLSFYLTRRIDGNRGMRFKEAIGITYKYWIGHGMIYAIGAIGSLFIVYELFINGLYLGQTQGEGGVYMGRLLGNILNNWVLFFTALNVLSLPVHWLSMKVLNAYGLQRGENRRDIKSQFVVSFLFLIALFLIVYLAIYFPLVSYLSNISIENNPLK
ncbi:MAG: heparinase II/III family protein [Candidatus Hodarchaeota archaeon]